MSWDISIQDLPQNAKSIDDIPENFEPQPLGPRKEIIEKILDIIPDVNFDDPGWGIIQNENISIEFNMGEDEVCEGFMLHVRSGGGTIYLIHDLLEKLGLKAIDCSKGELFKIDTADSSYQNWRAYRDRTIQE